MNLNCLEKAYLEMYLDWVNNYLTIETFSEHYRISVHTAHTMIDMGREINERLAQEKKGDTK